MKIIYNIGSEAIETVYTYEEWLKEYNRRETKRRIRQRTERLYYMKQRISGALFALPLGMFLMMTREKVMTF